MPIDTRSKRASSAQAFLPFVLAPLDPDGDIAGQGDRQHAVHDYSGITAVVTVVPELCIPGGVLVGASVGAASLASAGVNCAAVGTSAGSVELAVNGAGTAAATRSGVGAVTVG